LRGIAQLDRCAGARQGACHLAGNLHANAICRGRGSFDLALRRGAANPASRSALAAPRCQRRQFQRRSRWACGALHDASAADHRLESRPRFARLPNKRSWAAAGKIVDARAAELRQPELLARARAQGASLGQARHRCPRGLAARRSATACWRFWS
jgi:hypothetical protein